MRDYTEGSGGYSSESLAFKSKFNNYDDYEYGYSYDDIESIKRRYEVSKRLDYELIVILLSVFLTILAFVFIAYFLKWLYVFKYHVAMEFGASIILFITGYFLFLFKQKFQYLYGISEITFGLVSGWLIFSNYFEPPNRIPDIGIIAAAYLIVRGLTNCSDAKAKFMHFSKMTSTKNKDLANESASTLPL